MNPPPLPSQKKSSRWINILIIGALTLGGIGFLLYCFYCFAGTYEFTKPAELSEWYHAEFGTPSPMEVQSLQLKVSWMRDCSVTYFRFRTTPSRTELLINKNGFKSDYKGELEEVDGVTPKWWHPEEDHLDHFYVNSDWPKHSSEGSRYAYLGVSPRREIVCGKIVASW